MAAHAIAAKTGGPLFSIMQAGDLMYVPGGALLFERTHQHFHGWGFRLPLVVADQHLLNSMALLAQDLKSGKKNTDAITAAIQHMRHTVATRVVAAGSEAPGKNTEGLARGAAESPTAAGQVGTAPA